MVAIVAAVTSIIEQKTKIFPDGELKSQIVGVLKAAGILLGGMANAAIKDKTGVDLSKLHDMVVSGIKSGEDTYESNHEYDTYFGFNTVMEKLKEVLKELTERQTIVFLVDELDRCLPEYAIKVLERLHHLTEGIPNIVSIIAIDKEQLMCSIRNSFGFSNPEKYLEKFINFEIKLECGQVTENIREKYSDYFMLFDESIFEFPESVDEYLQAIFTGIEVRTQEQIMKRVMLAHKLLFQNRKDYAFLCMEILLAVMICAYNKCEFDNIAVDLTTYKRLFYVQPGNGYPLFVGGITRLIEDNKPDLRTELGYSRTSGFYSLHGRGNLYGAILYSWCKLHLSGPKISLEQSASRYYVPVRENVNDLKKFLETLLLIK